MQKVSYVLENRCRGVAANIAAVMLNAALNREADGDRYRLLICDCWDYMILFLSVVTLLTSFIARQPGQNRAHLTPSTESSEQVFQQQTRTLLQSEMCL